MKEHNDAQLAATTVKIMPPCHYEKTQPRTGGSYYCSWRHQTATHTAFFLPKTVKKSIKKIKKRDCFFQTRINNIFRGFLTKIEKYLIYTHSWVYIWTSAVQQYSTSNLLQKQIEWNFFFFFLLWVWSRASLPVHNDGDEQLASSSGAGDADEEFEDAVALWLGVDAGDVSVSEAIAGLHHTIASHDIIIVQ